MNCPRCKEALVHKDIEGETIDYCNSCNGMWLHRKQLDNIFKDAGVVEENSIDDNPHEDDHGQIVCRECKDVEMKKINFLDYSEIILDYCSQCGSFWLDKDELDQMHSYIEKVEEGSEEVRDYSGYNLLVKLSQIAYRIFH